MTKQFKVYLAGAISGLKYGEADDWRKYATNELAKGPFREAVLGRHSEEILYPAYYEHSGIHAYSPMRNNGFLVPMEGMPDTTASLSKIEAILTRDHWDCKTADLILVNLLEAREKVSIGTVMEIAWAHAYRIPVVLVMDKNNVHNHGLLIQTVGWVKETLDEGIQTAKAILLPDLTFGETSV